MADGCASHPSVFVVDRGTEFPPPLPPKPGQTRIRTRRNNLILNILLVLVCLALCGLVVEGYFIYNLHKADNTTQTNPQSPQAAAQKGGPNKEKPVSKKPKPPTILPPPKPLAHLTATKKPDKDGVMEWNEVGDHVLHELSYRDGKLTVHQEGYYYVYTKLSYSTEQASFIQSVKKDTSRYMDSSILLLTNRNRVSNSLHKSSMSNGYLGGVFHLYKGDAVFVHVNNGSLVRLQSSADNFFGMFML